MRIWMDVMRDLEHLIEAPEPIFDAWKAGGVDGLVIGPPVFHAGKLAIGHDRGRSITPAPGSPAPALTFDPDPAVYERFGVPTPAAPEAMPEARARLAHTFRAAKERGLSVWIFQAHTGAGGGSGGHHLHDETGIAAISARIVDTLEHYPEADGAVMDGPEWGYEIAPHHMGGRSSIFKDLPEGVEPMCADLGYDYGALCGARDRLHERLHALDPRQVALHAPGGFLGGYHLLGADPDLAAWMSFRRDSLTRYFRRIADGVREGAARPVKIGVGPRSAAFAPLCGYDFAALAGIVDLLLPKHYFWHRGFDGLVGTVARWVETLCLWNPGLSEGDGLAVVEALFGLVLPGVEGLGEMERALTPDFYDLVVTQETERALAALGGDAQRLCPWVDSGRAPHDGDPMSAADLRRLLEAAGASGLERFLYHHHGTLTSGEWRVMSEMCGEPWDPLRSDYLPPDEMVL